ncbi:Aryl-phospho-beta-D-glucosidase BglC [Lactococcus lactis]|nr:Aryl-phospho-beta-D-glucosidase BglC [Lactococcus lactis]
MEHKKLKAFPNDFLWVRVCRSLSRVEGAPFEDWHTHTPVRDNFVRIPGKLFKGTNGDVAVERLRALYRGRARKSWDLNPTLFRLLGRDLLRSGRKVNQQACNSMKMLRES